MDLPSLHLTVTLSSPFLFGQKVGQMGTGEPFVSKRGEAGQGWQIRRRGADADWIAFTLRGPGK